MGDSREDNIKRGLNETSHLTGEVWECGVLRGDRTWSINSQLNDMKDERVLRLFDTFSGMPIHTAGIDGKWIVGTMSDLTFGEVSERFKGHSRVRFEVGIMPNTFSGMSGVSISLINIDVDNYVSVKSCLEFVYPRMQSGGFVFLDDYNDSDCPGAKRAVSEFMQGKPETLVTDPTRGSPQAYFIKL